MLRSLFSPPDLVRRLCARSVFALIFISVILFTGCQTEAEEDSRFELDSRLIGTWIDSQWGDGYTITSTRIYRLNSVDSIDTAGRIVHAVTFSNTAGVIIYEYDEDKKPTYWEFDDNWNPIRELPLKGNFIGVYYKDLQPRVVLHAGNAWVSGGAEEPTLEAAIRAFTLDNEPKYMSLYGPYQFTTE